jgi:hypothetical protein
MYRRILLIFRNMELNKVEINNQIELSQVSWVHKDHKEE